MSIVCTLDMCVDMCIVMSIVCTLDMNVDMCIVMSIVCTLDMCIDMVPGNALDDERPMATGLDGYGVPFGSYFCLMWNYNSIYWLR